MEKLFFYVVILLVVVLSSSLMGKGDRPQPQKPLDNEVLDDGEFED